MNKVGKENSNWKGDKVGYHGIHALIKRYLEKTYLCQDCCKSFSYDLANISGLYKRDLSDWEWLCRRCHMLKDGRLKQFAELKLLQSVIGDATIPPPGTTNPSGTFTKFLNISERIGNIGGFGVVNFGSLAVEQVKKGAVIKDRKKTLDGIVNTKIKTLKSSNPKMNRSSLEKAARTLAFLEIRELDKENK